MKRKMKIICITSNMIGHLDFGGMGFLKLSKALAAKGDDVTWLSGRLQCQRVEEYGLKATESVVSNLALKVPYITAAFNNSDSEYRLLLSQMKSIAAEIAALKPDVVLVDRILSLAGFILDEMKIPTIAVGTPGGIWKDKANCIYPAEDCVGPLLEFGESLKKDLGWRTASLTSDWVDSSILNICFLGRSFYAIHQKSLPKAAFVNNFECHDVVRTDGVPGIAYGNNGDTKKISLFLEAAIEKDWLLNGAHIFMGNRGEQLSDLRQKYSSNQLSFHEWVDYTKYFQRLSYLVSFGGIGTVWHCINNNVPMLLYPCVGDQMLNAKSISALGLGATVDAGKDDHMDLADVSGDFDDSESYLESFNKFKSKDNFTDTINSVCSKIESFL